MNRTLMIAAVVSTFVVLGCEQKSDKPAEPNKATAETTNANNNANPAANTPTQTAPTTAQPVTIAESDLVTAADFEEETEKAITTKNYKTELASLETELAKE